MTRIAQIPQSGTDFLLVFIRIIRVICVLLMIFVSLCLSG